MTGKIITITQQKGGVGKSTIAAHIAVDLYSLGKKVLLIDIDPQGSLNSWYNIRKDLVQDNKLDFIHIAGWRLINEISRKSNYDFVIIDTPPHTESEAKTAIKLADLVIVPIQASPADIWAVTSTLKVISEYNKNFRLLLNRVQHNSKLLKELTGNLDNLFDTTIGNRVAFSSCFITGKCVTEIVPVTVASSEIQNLTKEIIKAI